MKKSQMKSHLIGLVLSALALIVLYFISVSLLNLFYPSEDAATRENFEELVRVIKLLEDGEEQEMPIFITDSFHVFGFEKGIGNNLEDVCKAEDIASPFIKPEICGEEGCICLCEEPLWKDTHECSAPLCQIYFGKSQFDPKKEKTYSFKGEENCPSAIIQGNSDPQIISVKREGSTIIIASTVTAEKQKEPAVIEGGLTE